MDWTDVIEIFEFVESDKNILNMLKNELDNYYLDYTTMFNSDLDRGLISDDIEQDEINNLLVEHLNKKYIELRNIQTIYKSLNICIDIKGRVRKATKEDDNKKPLCRLMKDSNTGKLIIYKHEFGNDDIEQPILGECKVCNIKNVRNLTTHNEGKKHKNKLKSKQNT